MKPGKQGMSPSTSKAIKSPKENKGSVKKVKSKGKKRK